ncbi:glycosyltransferase family 4 protein [Pseudomonas sp. GCM10022186]|uniref:glycosyltransferase family 4 protein n=1 Tax=Pseudomonas sp. GCM10022186 TaxID=3252650 RepID=UPI00360EDCED
MSTVFVTNIPAPYREKIHEIVSEELCSEYSVVFCAPIEPNREWKFEFGGYRHIFLESKSIQFNGRTIYLWSDVLRVLQKEDPAIVILSGFSFPMITAYLWAKARGRKTITFSDATLSCEKDLSLVHQLLRKATYPRMDACIGASLKTIQMFESYGAERERCFQSHLCADNESYTENYIAPGDRPYHIILCGQFISRKLFDFSLDVISRMSLVKKNLKVKLVGDGPLRDEILSRLETMAVDYCYRGFIDPARLAAEYASAKLLFFPTRTDPWGVVANEACAAGTPVITCSNAGAAHELVKDDVNGYVLPLDVELWARKAIGLLEDTRRLEQFSRNACEEVAPYNYENAARGIIDSIRFASGESN